MPPQFQFTGTSLKLSLIAQIQASASGNDALIDKGGQNIVFLGVALLAIAVVTVIGILSSRVEHAVIAAVILSFGLIGLFLTLGH